MNQDPGALAPAGARIIMEAFDLHVARFRDLTLHARTHFERRDWAAAQRDSARRLDLYGEIVQQGIASLQALLGERLEDRTIWASIRSEYEKLIAGRGDDELAETFFNSVTRRIFHTIGVDDAFEFVVSASPYVRAYGRPWSFTAEFENHGDHAELYARVLEHYRFAVDYDDLAGDAERIAAAVEAELEEARRAFWSSRNRCSTATPAHSSSASCARTTVSFRSCSRSRTPRAASSSTRCCSRWMT